MKVSASMLVCVLISAPAFPMPMSYQTDSGVKLVPQIKAFYEDNSNISKAEKVEGVDSVHTWGLEPSLLAKVERNQYQVHLLYKLNSGFSSDRQNDYNDHTFEVTNFFEFDRRNRLVINYRFQALHEARGESITEGKGDQLKTPIEFYQNALRTNYVFGAVGAQGRFELGIGYQDRIYQNYRHDTLGTSIEKTKYNDFQSPSAHLEFYLRAAPETYWLVGTRQRFTEYQHLKPNTPSKDNTTGFYYTGGEWAITGKTHGIVRLGYQLKDFQSKQRETFQGFSWDIGMEWQPQEQTVLTAKTTQAAVSPDQDGDYNLQTRYQLGVKHDWNSYLTTRLSGSYQQDKYTGSSTFNSSRNDERFALTAGVDYQIKRWVHLTADWHYQSKHSSQPGYTFNQNIWTLSGQFSL